MKKELKQAAQLLHLVQALEDRERWTFQSLESLRLKEVRALDSHKDQRKAAQDVFADKRQQQGPVTADELALQADFLHWSQKRDSLFHARIESAQNEVDAQRQVLVHATNRKKTIEEMFARLQRRVTEEKNKRIERAADEWVIQRSEADLGVNQ
jgi:hypothetical protein